MSDKAPMKPLVKLAEIDPQLPVLIAGPTASGKSDLALAIAEAQGGCIVNGDALQVWACWRVLSARPSEAECARAPHQLYGHKQPGEDYSTGHWLREVAGLLGAGPRPIIVGGTGLYFSALTEGLAVIPPVPGGVRAEADQLLAREGLPALLAGLDAATLTRIDPRNPARVQRAWEVQRATGKGLAAWQAETGAPLLSLQNATALVLEPERDWLNARIDRRFDAMIAKGALEEAAEVLPIWQANAPWARAIGAPELIAHLRGEVTLNAAIEAAKLASRQYAKRQRTWFRARMAGWQHITLP